MVSFQGHGYIATDSSGFSTELFLQILFWKCAATSVISTVHHHNHQHGYPLGSVPYTSVFCPAPSKCNKVFLCYMDYNEQLCLYHAGPGIITSDHCILHYSGNNSCPQWNTSDYFYNRATASQIRQGLFKNCSYY